MPTPVSAARQCLTDEAARALDDAVAVARRRSHAQTTSLHAVSALLALPSSMLREACVRARSSAYSPRLQFRALELCVGVSLDRLPSAKTLDEPPVSNSLMAAIKRSQANQRRHPENFHLHQLHQQQQQQTTSLLKVELKHFILSILDDPIVSRVFGEAGFRSCDIKLAIVHPPVTPASRFSRARCPPIFLCNLTDPDPGQRGFRFPFMGVSGGDERDENCRRIGEVLVRKTGKNPLLVGVCANDALNSFSECVQRGKGGVLPPEIDGLKLVCIEKEVSELVGKGGSDEKMDSKFKEVGDMVKNCSGPGIVVNFGELASLVGDVVLGGEDAVSYLVSKLTGLLKLHVGKLWLMGAAGSYETYSKFLGRFPSVEKDWDLHLLPITSSKASIDGFCSKPSLMGSFVPFGGFFSTPSDFKIPLSNTNITRCHLCNEKYDQEVSALSKGGSTISVADQYSASLPSWLQMAELDPREGEDVAKAKDDGTAFNAKIMGLQKKWNDICQRLHHAPQFSKPDISQARTQIPGTEGFQFVADRKESSSKDSSLSESGCANIGPCMPKDLQKGSPPKQGRLISVASEAENANFLSKLPVKISNSQQLQTESPWFRPKPPPDLSLPPDCISSTSVASVTTDLGLGTLYASPSQELKKFKFQDHKEHHQYFLDSVSVEFDRVNENTSKQIAKSSYCSRPDIGGRLDLRDFKSLWRVLVEKVGWQDEVICTISRTISCCRNRNGNGKHPGSNVKGDIWLSFLGPDKVGKKKIAAALAEIMFGSRESLISVDLSFQNGINQSNSIFDRQESNGYDVKFRGKTVVDCIAGELGKRPHSVVFLENVDKADLLAQTSLSQAIKTGKFPDSHGREISVNDMVFVTTSTITKGNKNFISGSVEYSEERILKAKCWQMQIVFGCVSGDASRSSGTNVLVTLGKGTSSSISANKRKLIEVSDSTKLDETSEIPKRAQKASKSYLDLNLPVEEMEDIEYGNCDSDSMSDNTESWLEDFFDQVDEKVIFKPFDFDVLADKILKEISLNLQRTVGSEVLLEIDREVMEQILAAAWLADKKRAVEDWIEGVLSRSFAEARQRHCLTSQSVMKLVACEGLFMEEEAPGVCLPARIFLN
ncbi:hypothetical protein L1049_013854 [Liquidambar formosana]|uniref:Clp R domain-containing protein n=1 Tax=Liquidambar formosana TaxID=63359 RepID=A0AAP0RL67_LIQFO